MSMPRVILFLSVCFFTACSSSEKKADTAEGAFQIAKDYEKEERYDIAIQKYHDIRSKYPYSKYSLQAELAIADCYFAQESYPEAQVSYQSFKDLHPKHPQSDYVVYRLAMSYFKQLPAYIDRDLTQSSNAIATFDELIKHYPNSKFVKEAEEKRVEVLKMLAQKEVYIADFYFKKKKYSSAHVRYENSLRKYPNLGIDERALAYGAISAARAGKKERAQVLLAELKRKFPNSSEVKTAEKEANQ